MRRARRSRGSISCGNTCSAEHAVPNTKTDRNIQQATKRRGHAHPARPAALGASSGPRPAPPTHNPPTTSRDVYCMRHAEKRKTASRDVVCTPGCLLYACQHPGGRRGIPCRGRCTFMGRYARMTFWNAITFQNVIAFQNVIDASTPRDVVSQLSQGCASGQNIPGCYPFLCSPLPARHPSPAAQREARAGLGCAERNRPPCLPLPPFRS